MNLQLFHTLLFCNINKTLSLARATIMILLIIFLLCFTECVCLNVCVKDFILKNIRFTDDRCQSRNIKRQINFQALITKYTLYIPFNYRFSRFGWLTTKWSIYELICLDSCFWLYLVFENVDVHIFIITYFVKLKLSSTRFKITNINNANTSICVTMQL